MTGNLSLAVVESDRQAELYTLEEVRGLIDKNTVKDTMESRDENIRIDAELMVMIDTHTDFQIFIAGDNVYSRDELCEAFPFERLRIEPGDVFAQQEIGVFPVKGDTSEHPELEYVARDVGNEEDFVTVDVMVSRATKKKCAVRQLIKVVKTEIFLGKKKWANFQAMASLTESIRDFIVVPLLKSGASASEAARLVPMLLSGGGPHSDNSGHSYRNLAIGPARKNEGSLLARERDLLARERDLLARERELLTREQAKTDV